MADKSSENQTGPEEKGVPPMGGEEKKRYYGTGDKPNPTRKTPGLKTPSGRLQANWSPKKPDKPAKYKKKLRPRLLLL